MFEWMQTHPDLYAWGYYQVDLVRVIDVSLNARGLYLAGINCWRVNRLWEVLIWLVAIGHATQNLSNPMRDCLCDGICDGQLHRRNTDGKMSLGVVLVRILTHENSDNLIDALKNQKYGLTSIDGHGAFGPMKVIFTIVQRQSVDEVIKIIQSHNPNAFYSIESIGEVSKGKLAPRKLPGGLSVSQVFRQFRKGK